MRRLKMPRQTIEYLFMGIIAGIIAGVVLVYVVGVTYMELIRIGESMKMAFKP